MTTFSDLVASILDNVERPGATTQPFPLFAEEIFLATGDEARSPDFYRIGLDRDYLPLFLIKNSDRVALILEEPTGEPTTPGEIVQIGAPQWLVELLEIFTDEMLELRRLDGLFDGDDDPETGKPTRLRYEREIGDHVTGYRYDRRHFFASDLSWMRWECLSRADSWLKSDLKPEDAAFVLGLTAPEDISVFAKILGECRSGLNQGEFTVDVNFVEPAVPFTFAASHSVMRRYVVPVSLGGEPRLGFPLPESFPTRGHEVDHSNHKNLWWWRCVNWPQDGKSIYPQWPGDLCNLFMENWASSAFFYEYRWRRNRGKEAPLFGALWPQLRGVQRALLHVLWPPDRLGENGIRKPSHPIVAALPQSENLEIRCTVNLAKMSDQAILDDIQEMLTRERSVRGFPTPGKGKGAIRKAYRWAVLEEMDRVHFNPKFSFKRTLSAAKSHVETDYKFACQAAGIHPA